MSEGESEDDQLSELPDLKEVALAKENNPMMFVSGFDADDDGIIPSANPNSPGERLLQAAEDGNPQEVSKILDELPDLVHYKDVDGYTALHRACYEDNLETAILLISYGAQVTAMSGEGWTPLHSAAHWNAYRCVRILLENGANVNALTKGGLTPLHLASGNNSAKETVMILLTDPGVDITIKNRADETAYQICRRSTQLYYLFEMHRESVIKI